MKDPFHIIAARLLGKAPLVQLVPSHHSAQTGTAQAAAPSLTPSYAAPRQTRPNALPQHSVVRQPDAVPRRAGLRARPSLVQEAQTQVRAGNVPSCDGPEFDSPETGSNVGPDFGPGFDPEVSSGRATVARTVPEESHAAQASAAMAGPKSGCGPREDAAVGPVADRSGPSGTKARAAEQGGTVLPVTVLPVAGLDRTDPAPNRGSAVDHAGPVQRDGAPAVQQDNPAAPREGRFIAAGADEEAGRRGSNVRGAEPDEHRARDADETGSQTRRALPATEGATREARLEQQRHDAGQTSAPSVQSNAARPDQSPGSAQPRPVQQVNGSQQQRAEGYDVASTSRVAKPATSTGDGAVAQGRGMALPPQDDGRHEHALSGRSQQGGERAARKPEGAVVAEPEAARAGADPLTATEPQGTLAKSRGAASQKADPQGRNARRISAAGDQLALPHRPQAEPSGIHGAERHDTANPPDRAGAHDARPAAARDTAITGARPAVGGLDAAQQSDATLRRVDSPSQEMRSRIEQPTTHETRQPFEETQPSKDVAVEERDRSFVVSNEGAGLRPDGRDPFGGPQTGTQNTHLYLRQEDDPARAAPTGGGGADGMLHLHIERLEIVRSTAPVDPNPSAPPSAAKRAAPLGLDRFLSGKRR